MNETNKKISKLLGSGITRTNNDIEDITKVIKSLENRAVLLKGTTEKVISQEGGFCAVIFLLHQ